MASWTARPGRPVGVDGGAGIAEFQKQGVAREPWRGCGPLEKCSEHNR
jgi:hypothetical protein